MEVNNVDNKDDYLEQVKWIKEYIGGNDPWMEIIVNTERCQKTPRTRINQYNNTSDAKDRPRFNQKTVYISQREYENTDGYIYSWLNQYLREKTEVNNYPYLNKQNTVSHPHEQNCITNNVRSLFKETKLDGIEDIKNEFKGIIDDRRLSPPFSFQTIAELYCRKNNIGGDLNSKSYRFKLYCIIALVIADKKYNPIPQKAIRVQNQPRHNNRPIMEREPWLFTQVAILRAAHFTHGCSKEHLADFYNSFVGICLEVEKERSAFSILRKVTRELGLTKDSPYCRGGK